MSRLFAAWSALSAVARRRALAGAVAVVVLALVAGFAVVRSGNVDGNADRDRNAGSNAGSDAGRVAALKGAPPTTVDGTSTSSTTATTPTTTVPSITASTAGPTITATTAGPTITTTTAGPTITTTTAGPTITTTTAGPTITTTTAGPNTTVATTSPPPPPSGPTTQVSTGNAAPFSGRPVDAAQLNRPALAVKIDNFDAPSETAVPQTGLNKTDVVFEEIVEGDITRLVAVFQSQTPERVGPVRSARTTDLTILPQLGRPLLAWSGGNDGVVRAVHASPSIIDEGFDAVPSAYSRDRSRAAPHNLYVRPANLWARAPQGLAAPPPLFTYRAEGQPPPPTARPSSGVDLRWGPTSQAPARWRWDANLHRYLREQRGRPHVDTDGSRLSATNVVVLVTEYGRSPADTRSPEAHTVGAGEAFVFTDGSVVHGHWDRPDVNRPATLTDDAGAPIALTPGNTWVELPMPGGTRVG